VDIISASRFCLCLLCGYFSLINTSWVSHCGVSEDSVLLRRDTLSSTTRRNLDCFTFEDEGKIFFRNVGNQRNSAKSINLHHYLGTGLATGTEHNQNTRKGGTVEDQD
jgi:hypothetical protein